MSVILLSRHCNNNNNDINDNNDVIKRVLFFYFYTFSFDILLILLDAIQGWYNFSISIMKLKISRKIENIHSSGTRETVLAI